MLSVGIDIGGTNAKIGIVEDGKILAYKKVKTVMDRQAFFSQISAGVFELLNELGVNRNDVKGVGVGSPGAITSSTGVVECFNTLHWYKVPLGEELSRLLQMPVRVTNDANAAAVGEVKYGAGKNYNTAILITLGTGVGGGIIIDGKLYEGNESKGAEIGHTTLILGGEQCPCGRKGCAEAYVSGTALIRDTIRAMEKDKTSLMWEHVKGDVNSVDGTTAYECAKKGDKTALVVYNNYAYMLSEYIMNLCNIFRPEAIIIGGGISAHGDFLIDKVKNHCVECNYGYKGTPPVAILTATLGNDAGILGASAMVE
ncbi:MAG: ROK family protein [Clostridiales bacterium]|nr:ROK family protein [Clostridiales bacterium]